MNFTECCRVIERCWEGALRTQSLIDVKWRSFQASNPGQFDNGESDVSWQKTSNGSSVFHPGPVCIGTDRPQATLTVAGDIACTGQVFHPSDRRIKDNISEINYEKALGRLDKLRVVEYSIRPEIAREWGISEEARHRVGIIAQELAEIMPDAVNEDGDYLTVDDNRIFYDTVAAAKELSRLTGNLECKIDEVEKISQKLARLARLKKLGSFKSTQSVISGAGLSQAGSEASSGICAGGGSYISCSRSSLGSASPPSYRKSDKGKDRPDVRYTSGHSTHRHQKHCRHACHRVDQGLCSNKIIQWTIAILVAVMAFCVLAMATLYTLDWYKRNYGTPTYVTPAPAITARPDAAKDGGPGNIIEVKPSASWRPPKQRGVPEISPCKEAQCQAYCCGDPLAYETDSGAKAADVDIVVALPGAKAEDNKYSNDQQSRSRRYNSESPIASNSVLLGPAQPFADVRIEIPEFNITLDQRYCQGGNCSKPKEGRFDLYIPISTYMPTIPLEIVFETGSKRYVDSCGRPEDFAWKHCVWKNNDPFKSSKEVDSSRLPGAKKKSVNVFEIPAGDFIKSAYTFRVGYTTESCTMNIDQKGKGFDEYRLFFYRSCSNDKAFD
uniref:Peptidase S74 domain-containing protein n=1 Tax=Plectus sambesii TaxID=2011161 RepID=A0A914UTB5_9BILA